MWIKFDKIQQEERISAKSGKEYTAYVMYGTKIGGKLPSGRVQKDEPFEKIFFDNSLNNCTTKDGTRYPNTNVVSFLQNNANPGDTIELKSIKDQSSVTGWTLSEIRFVSNPGQQQEEPAEQQPTPPWIR